MHDTGCGCTICSAKWELGIVHDYVWEGEEDEDVR
jgi:hypothetical protein